MGQIEEKERRSHIQNLLHHAKEHEMMVKDFNQHKSNGGTATTTTIDEIKTFKFKKGNNHRAKGSTGKHTANAAHHTHPENALHGQEMSQVWNKIILVHAVGQRKRARRMAKDHPMVGTL